MELEIILLGTSILLLFILVLMLAVSGGGTKKGNGAKNVRDDLKKIKKQINGDGEEF